MPTLKRVEIETPDAALAAARAELARRAAAELGYGRLGRVLGSRTLLEDLRQIGVRPFTVASVERYKRRHRHRGMFTGTRDWLLLLAALPVTAGAAFGIWWHLPGLDSGWEVPVIMAAVLTTAAAVINLIVVLGTTGDIGRGKREVVDWKTLPLSQFAGDIPEFALDRALEIKKKIPGCSLQIDGLYEATENMPRPDPFLVVVRGTETYHVDVWDEVGYQIEYFPGC